MAATKRNAMLIAETRHRVQVSQLINRLQDHADGKCEMSPTQVRAAEILLKKALPDLAAVTHSGDPESPVHYRIDAPVKETREEWLARQMGSPAGAAVSGDPSDVVH